MLPVNLIVRGIGQFILFNLLEFKILLDFQLPLLFFMSTPPSIVPVIECIIGDNGNKGIFILKKQIIQEKKNISFLI